MTETFICKGCIEAGLSEEEATRNYNDGEELPEGGALLCPHCFDCEMEDRGIPVFRLLSPTWQGMQFF